MFINKENFDAWMERIMERLDKLDRALEKMGKAQHVLDGERLLDNQDLCQLLNVSKRSLQRYRDLGELPFQTIYHKMFYKESDVRAFMLKNFSKKRRRGGKEGAGDEPESINA